MRELRLMTLAGALVAVCGCGGGGGGNPADTTAPAVVATAPSAGATAVAFNAVVTATFSEAVDPASVTPTSLSVRQGATPVSGSVSVVGSTVAFRPEPALRSGVTYTATLDGGISDLAGNALGDDLSWQFTVTDYNVAFVTSVAGNGDLGSWADAGGETGLAAGDAICRARAAAAGLENAGRFKAWLSSAGVDAKDRISSDGPWVRTDGVLVAANKADLLDGSLFTSITVTETGAHFPIPLGVLTGTTAAGTATAANCNGWTDAGGGSATIGIPHMAHASWSEYDSTSPCSSQSLRYCFED